MSNIVRTTLLPGSNICEFKSTLLKRGRSIYYLALNFGEFYIVKYKKSFGIIPTYTELTSFRYIDICRFINANYDTYGIEINETLKKDPYLNDEARLFFIKNISWDELGANNFGNFGHDYLASSAAAHRSVGMDFRLAELHDREQNEVSSSELQPPWAYEKE